jgi:hypothetical protein
MTETWDKETIDFSELFCLLVEQDGLIHAISPQLNPLSRVDYKNAIVPFLCNRCNTVFYNTPECIINRCKSGNDVCPNCGHLVESELLQQKNIEQSITSTASRKPILKEKHFRIEDGAKGYSYNAIFGDYLKDAESIEIEDPYIRLNYQVQLLINLIETVVKLNSVTSISIITSFDDELQKEENTINFNRIKNDLFNNGITFTYLFRNTIHDREIKISNGWIIKIGRGLDLYYKPDNWFSLGASDLDFRTCKETIVDIFTTNDYS